MANKSEKLVVPALTESVRSVLSLKGVEVHILCGRWKPSA